jgi:hypothetical protein
MKRLHRSRGCTSAHRDIAFRRGSDGGQAAPIGDWVSDNPVLTLSCGSCSASTYTSSVDHCVLGMQRSPHPFRSESKPVTQEPSSSFLLAAPGISSCATRRTLAAGRRSRIDPRETYRACRYPFRSLEPIRCWSLAAESPRQSSVPTDSYGVVAPDVLRQV